MGPLFTDLYQLTMALGYFASGKHKETAVFELFFRRCPFDGEFAVLGGFDLVKDFLENFKFSEADLTYLRSLPAFQGAPEAFFDELKNLNLNDVEILAIPEGEIVFAREPLLQIRGPIMKVQLLESALLNAINFSTLVATCARRMRIVAENRELVEFGLRRAQGPNGAMTATRSAYLGGFNATSNVEAGQKLGIPVVGTMAHSFVQSFCELSDADKELLKTSGVDDAAQTNQGELSAFIAYAKVFPHSALLLVDTYDTLRSGVPNAIRVFKILRQQGRNPLGVRLDSGDLVYLSIEARRMLDAAGFSDAKIFASNELDERTIESLQDQGARIDAYGVGTNLVTATEQPALGGVYKLVQLNGRPRMKISQQTEKLIIPSAKKIFRLYGKDGLMLLDLLTTENESPKPGDELLALHPSDPFKQVVVRPSEVRELLQPLYRNNQWLDSFSLNEKRSRSLQLMHSLRADIARAHNPAPYKVAVSPALKKLMEELYRREAPPSKIE